MLSQGPNNCGTCADVAGVGTNTWLDSGGTALEGDEVSASGGDAAEVNDGPSHYLRCTNFGFNIPANAAIRGILVESRILESDPTCNTVDAQVRIVKGGSIGTTDRSSGTEWPTSASYRSYGGSSDLWGEGWSPANINASNFGYAHAINSAGIAFVSDAIIDHVRITVFYDLIDTGGII